MLNVGRADRISTYSAGPSLYRMLKDGANKNPKTIALTAPGYSPITYGRLLRQIESISQKMSDLGIGRNDRVAAMLPNGLEMALAFLGTAVGATCVPLNPGCQASEFDFYLADLNPKALIVKYGAESPAKVIARKRSIPIIESLLEVGNSTDNLVLKGNEQPFKYQNDFAAAHDIALILYTSGTTSRPKMVPLTHSNLLASALNIAATLQLTAEDRCLNVMPLFHIHGLVGAVLTSLVAGASVVCTPGFDSEHFFSWLEDFRPSWYTAVPTIHQAILSCAERHNVTRARYPFRFVRSSSAALPPRVMRELENVLDAPVIEAYGMTEAAHQITSNPLPPGQRKLGSVGLVAGVEVAVMNGEGSFVPAGQVGEIVIRGASVMSGYANKPEPNKEDFRDGWFRTGDQGYLDSDGYLFITGRLKEIVNRGGEKVSLREIEQVLLDHPHVCEVAAFALPHPTLGEDMVVAVVTLDKTRVTERMLRDYLIGQVAAFKIPSRLLIVDEIPKSPTGKVQRVELAAKFAHALKTESAAPQNKLETMVASIYADVLDVEKINRTDNFFSLGGDSLRATQVISRVRAFFHVNLSIATIFRKSTVAELADEIDRAPKATDPKLIAQVLKQVENLSEEGIQRDLKAKRTTVQSQNNSFGGNHET